MPSPGTFKPLITAIAALCSAVAPASADRTSVSLSPKTDLAVRFAPDLKGFKAQATLTGHACQGAMMRLHLNRTFNIDRVTVDGRAAWPRFDPPGAAPFALSMGRALDIPCPRRAATLAYRGGGLIHPDGRNQVTPELIELSVYGVWYPISDLDHPTPWRLTADLPFRVPFVTNGIVGERGGARRIDARLDRGADIVLVASPAFTDTPAGPRSSRVLIGRDQPVASIARARALAVEAAATADWLAGLLGPASGEGPRAPTLVFTRRGGPLAYSRLPLIVTQQAELASRDGRSLELNTRHEVAHFWSRARGSADDWINEGFAEYVALRRTAEIEGAAVSAAVLGQYRREVAAAGPGVSILQTANDERRGYINRYQRASLLLTTIERRAGLSATNRFLRAAFATAEQTTSSVEAVATRELGPELGTLFSACLRARDWPERCGGLA